jgi:hypothetical protein
LQLSLSLRETKNLLNGTAIAKRGDGFMKGGKASIQKKCCNIGPIVIESVLPSGRTSQFLVED